MRDVLGAERSIDAQARLRRPIDRVHLGGWAEDCPWIVVCVAIAALALAPILTIGLLAANAPSDTWPHLASTVLPAALRDTAILLAGVAGIAIGVGVSTAWLVTAYRFPGQRFFSWALLLPLAVPTYIVAYSYAEMFDSFGPVQGGLRHLFGWTSRADYWFPNIRSIEGAIVVMGFVLYPYVYLTARAVFSMQASCVLEVSRTLGSSRRASFFAIALPLARPAIAMGATLALIEAMNDIGAAEYLGVQTLTVSVYSTWLNRGSLAGAAQIACVALGVVFLLSGLERWARRHHRYAAQAQSARRLAPLSLQGKAGVLASGLCALPIMIGFGIPAVFLLERALERTQRNGLLADFWQALGHSVVLAGLAAVLAVSCSLVLVYAARIARTPIIRPLVRLSGIGYAVPGTVFAIGMLAPLAGFDNAFNATIKSYFGFETGLLLLGSGVGLVLAYLARYLVVASGTLEAGFAKISSHLDMAARNLGRTRLAVIREIHLPLIRPALSAGFLLVFVDVMKELPATLLLRPLEFETLATLVYGQASRGQFEEGALAALAIVAVGILPVILLSRIGQPADLKMGRRTGSA